MDRVDHLFPGSLVGSLLWQFQVDLAFRVRPGVGVNIIELENLRSWTELVDLRFFSGTVTYETEFTVPDGSGDLWLDLGGLHETAEVFVNSRPTGCLWTGPYVEAIGEACNPGVNELRIEVTNLTANRVIALEQSGIHIKDRHYFVNYNYQPFDAENWTPLVSGLLGPVKIRSVP